MSSLSEILRQNREYEASIAANRARAINPPDEIPASEPDSRVEGEATRFSE